MARSIHRATALLTSISLLAGAPLHAQDTPTPEEQAQKAYADETARITAKAERANAEAALVKAKTDALGIPEFKGETTVDATSGKFEGAMLASGAVNEAARMIAAGIPADAKKSIVLLAHDDTLDFSAAAVLPREMKAISAVAADVIKRDCPDKGGKPAGPGVGFLPALSGAAPLIGAALNLLRTDTTVTGYAIDVSDAALIDALAGVGAKAGPVSAAGESAVSRKFVIPGELVVADPGNPVVSEFDKLLAHRETLGTCSATLAAETDDKAKAAAAPKLARVTAALARIDGYVENVTTAGEKGPAPLAQAVLASTLRLKHSDMTVLRVTVEGAGGSMLKRSNLWTMLGAPAFGLTGGLMVHWRFVDPETGSTLGGGKLVCSTRLTNLRAVHDGKIGKAWCGGSVQKK